MRRLDIGAGTNPFKPEDPEWEHLDARRLPHIEHICEIRNGMPFEDCLFDELRAYSILEHVEYRLVPRVLSEWNRVMKQGAKLSIVVPYIDGILRGRGVKGTSDKDFMGYLGGEQDYPENYHLAHFDRQLMETRLIEAGFKNISFLEPFSRDPLPDMCLEMLVESYK